GYIDASLDPIAFRERWSATPMPGAVLNPAAAGGGKLYVSTNGYFSTQKLVALDAATGSQVWQRDFGGIFGVNSPTYSNGTVFIPTGGHEDTFLYGLDQGDGTLKFKTAFDSQWERWRAPIVLGSMIFTAGGYYGGMYGFDLASGARRFFLNLPQVDG